MAGFFDTLNNVINDPQFQTGMGLLGAGQGIQSPMLNAYKLMQQSKQQVMENQLAQQKIANEQQQVLTGKATAEHLGAQTEVQKQMAALEAQKLAGQQKFQDMITGALPGIMRGTNGFGSFQPQSGQSQPPAQQQPMSGGPDTMVQPQQPMSMFPVADKFVAQAEGGLGPDGGKYGIDPKAHPEVNFNTLTPEGAQQIRSQYWNGIGGDQLVQQFGPKAAMVAYDTAINQGPSFAEKILQETGGNPDLMMALRKQRYEDIARTNPMKAANLPGWMNRLDNLSSYIKTADGGQPQQPTQPPQAPQPQQQGGLEPYRNMQVLGALGAAMGNDYKGFGEMMGQAFKPQIAQPGSLRIGPSGQIENLPNNPLDIAKLDLQRQQTANEIANRNSEMQSRSLERDIKQQGQIRALATDTGAASDAVAKGKMTINSINDLLQSKGFDHITGRYSLLPDNVRTQIDPDGRNATAALTSIKSQMFLEVLQSLKSLSKNGSSGFGQLSDTEGEQIRNSMGSLETAQTTDALKKSLETIRDNIQSAVDRTKNVYNTTWGQQAQGLDSKTVKRTGTVKGRKVIQYTDGRIEYAD